MRDHDHDNQDSELLPIEDACPVCGERRIDFLVWLDDQWVQCQTCRIQYDPMAGFLPGTADGE